MTTTISPSTFFIEIIIHQSELAILFGRRDVKEAYCNISQALALHILQKPDSYVFESLLTHDFVQATLVSSLRLYHRAV